MSQRLLADLAGVNQSVVSRIERGDDALASTWEKLFSGLGERIEFEAWHTSEDWEGLIIDERDARIDRRLEGLMARFGRR